MLNSIFFTIVIDCDQRHLVNKFENVESQSKRSKKRETFKFLKLKEKFYQLIKLLEDGYSRLLTS